MIATAATTPTTPTTPVQSPNAPLSATLSMPSDTEIVITREFNAPRDLVWEAFSKPEHLKRWWGTRDTTMLVCDVDLRVGGAWRFVIGAPGSDEQHAFSGEYLEIQAPEKVVFTERYEPIPGSDHTITATYTERDGKTTLRSHITYASREHRDGHLQSGMEPGLQETYRRLDELLLELSKS